MGLTKTQLSIVNKAQSVGGSKQGIALDDEQCAYLVGVVAKDLGILGKLNGFPTDVPPFFASAALESLRLPGLDFLLAFEELVGLDRDADAYFDCLAYLHKARLEIWADTSDAASTDHRPGRPKGIAAIRMP